MRKIISSPLQDLCNWEGVYQIIWVCLESAYPLEDGELQLE